MAARSRATPHTCCLWNVERTVKTQTHHRGSVMKHDFVCHCDPYYAVNQFGIGIKTTEPRGIRTDFFTRSLDTARHPAYDALVNKFMGLITDPKQMETYSSPEQIAEVVYEAASDGKDQLRYVAGADAKAMYAMRLQLGDEASRKAMAQQFFGETKAA